MEIDFLRHFGLPAEHIAILRKAYGDRLLPLQEKVVREGGLLESKNCLICAPTSAGKTFLAEILFLYHAVHARKVILLVPTKALANQRYCEWKDRYVPLGYDILLSTRDHPFQDRRILENRFHLAIVIYEKMRSLLSADDAWLSSLGACVADEIHYLFHPTRGADLEFLLTRLRGERGLQMVGLSSVCSDPETAKWLGADLIVEENRPVELRQGVLCRGRFTYQEFNTHKKGVEKFPFEEGDDDGLAMLEAARYLAAQGESTLLFWPRKDQCYTAARKLAEERSPNPHTDLRRVQELEPGFMKQFLLELLPRGIAVHTSDLTVEERSLVEILARSGEVDLICATGTLAEGLNFPVVNVLTTQRMYSTRPAESESLSASAPMLIQYEQLLNMTGRAGRLGYSTFGRGMIVTCAPGDIDGLMNQYQPKNAVSSEPLPARMPFNQAVLRCIGSLRGCSIEQCHRLLQKTLTGYRKLWPENLDIRLGEAVGDLLRAELITLEAGRMFPTPLGELVCRSGLSEHSAVQISRYVKEQLLEEPHPLDVLLFISLLDEMQEFYISVSKSQMQGHQWSRCLHQYIEEHRVELCPESQKLLSNPVAIRPEHHRAFKRVLLLLEWIQGVEVLDLESNFGLYAGAITRLGEEAGWLIGCLAEAAAAHAREPRQVNHLQRLQERAVHGIHENALAWVPVLRKRQLSRRDVLKLTGHGFEKPGDLKTADRSVIESLISSASMRVLFPSESAQNQDAAIPESHDEVPVGGNGETEAPAPDLHEVCFNHVRPNQVLINGTPVAFSPMQLRLLRCLANRAGECVAYETLFSKVWTDTVGDRKLLAQLKKQVCKRLEENVGPLSPDLIETVPSQGLILNAYRKEN